MLKVAEAALSALRPPNETSPPASRRPSPFPRAGGGGKWKKIANLTQEDGDEQAETARLAECDSECASAMERVLTMLGKLYEAHGDDDAASADAFSKGAHEALDTLRRACTVSTAKLSGVQRNASVSRSMPHGTRRSSRRCAVRASSGCSKRRSSSSSSTCASWRRTSSASSAATSRS